MADRRRIQASSSSDAAPMSPTFMQNTTASLHLLSLLETETPPPPTPALTGIDIDLKHMLSVRSIISTSSSEARRHTAAASSSNATFSKIGAGACGAIFARDGQSTIVKLAKKGFQDDLWNDYRMHSVIATGFHKHNIDLSVPACEGFVGEDNLEFWEHNDDLVQAAQDVVAFPTTALIAERIFPLPEPVRVLLIKKFCAPRIQAKALEDRANRDCLVRPYLGSQNGKSGGMFFSLRNFKLHLNQMEELQLNVDLMTEIMGRALAVMHWAALKDARDVEFVLGSSVKREPARSLEPNLSKMERPPSTELIGPPSTDIIDFAQRATTLWLLDFNQVRDITADAAGVLLAIEAYKLNDPYFPKPCQAHPLAKKIWNSFVTSYISMSHTILGSSELPVMFIQGIITMQKEKEEQKCQRS